MLPNQTRVSLELVQRLTLSANHRYLVDLRRLLHPTFSAGRGITLRDVGVNVVDRNM